jgi:Zn-dependent peptidase ImmA (M78 family)
MTGDALPTTPAGRISLLLTRTPDAAAELGRALLLSPDMSVDQALAGGLELSLSDLVAAADVLDVPVTVLVGQVPLDRNLAVSLRLGLAQKPNAPVEDLEYADMLLQHRALLDLWQDTPATSPVLAVPLSHDHLYKKAGQVTAEHVRDALRIGDEPIVDLVDLVEDCGVPVAFRALQAGVHGLNVRQEHRGRVLRAILVSTRDPWTRQRYTLAHEMCHGLYDDEGQVIIDEVTVPDTLPELRAEAFARHLLLPQRALRNQVVAARNRGEGAPVLVARLMTAYGISRDALLNALVADGHATEERVAVLRAPHTRVAELMENADLVQVWNELSEGQHEPSGSPWLVRRALDAYGSGWVDVSVVADLVDREVSDTERQLAATGWSPASD